MREAGLEGRGEEKKKDVLREKYLSFVALPSGPTSVKEQNYFQLTKYIIPACYRHTVRQMSWSCKNNKTGTKQESC